MKTLTQNAKAKIFGASFFIFVCYFWVSLAFFSSFNYVWIIFWGKDELLALANLSHSLIFHSITRNSLCLRNHYILHDSSSPSLALFLFLAYIYSIDRHSVARQECKRGARGCCRCNATVFRSQSHFGVCESSCIRGSRASVLYEKRRRTAIHAFTSS